MNIKIIPLAARKIELRKITLDMLNKTIELPDQTVKGYGGRTVKQKIYNVNNKDKLLRVVCEKEGKDIIVVTAYLSSQIKKYMDKK